MEIKTVAVAGAGVMGAQIATQCAYMGYDVVVYEIAEGLGRSRELLAHFHDLYLRRLAEMRNPNHKLRRGLSSKRDITPEEVDELEARFEAGSARMRITTVPTQAFSDADLVIEAVSERSDVKAALYKMIAPLLKEDAIIVTNTSTMLPSMFAAYTARPERYLSLHFSNCIWTANTAEIMGHPASDAFPATDPEALQQVIDFAVSINMEPIVLNKEQPRYILNSLLMPFLDAAAELLVNGVADVQTIDKTWEYGNDTTFGPFRVIDVIGLPTYYNIVDANPRSHNPEDALYRVRELLADMIAEGRLGMNAGAGFYDYEE